MVIYCIFLVISFIILCFVKGEKYKFADICMLILLICFSGFRYGIGTDYSMYERIYLSMSTIPISLFRTGIGYYYFSYFLYKILPNTAIPLFFIISMITCLFIYKFCKKMSINPGMSIFLFICLGYYTASFNVFRQFLSISFFVFGYACLKEKNKIKMVILFILSILIHQVSIVPICIVWFTRKLRKVINVKVLFLFVLGILIFYDLAYKVVMTLMKSVSIYSNSKDFFPGIGTFLQILYYFIILVFIDKNKLKIIGRTDSNLQMVNLFIISFFIMLLGIKNILFVRLASYLNIFSIILIPELYNIYELKNKKLEKIVYYLFFIIYFFVYIKSFGDVVPYHSIFL